MKKILVIIAIVIVAAILLFVKYILPDGTTMKDVLKSSSKNYQTYSQCVKESQLPCTFRYVGDMGHTWDPSTYKTKEQCIQGTAMNGVSCSIPGGTFIEERWISNVDIQRANAQE